MKKNMPKKILVVDDSASARQSVKTILGRDGYAVLTAVDGIDALRKISEEMIDLVVTEINMPNLDGLSFTEEVRQRQCTSKTPVIILTTENDDAIKSRAMKLGASEWIEKPLKADGLINAVKKVLG